MSPRKMLRISDVFISHRHMDHFMGFDQLLRCLLGRQKRLRLFGPSGTIAAVEHKLRAYSWNLISNYDGELVICVRETGPDGQITRAEFHGRTGFERIDVESPASGAGLLLDEPGFSVRSVALDHGVPSMAFALQERAQINIWRNRIEAMGLATGPWLRAFKDAVLRNENDAFPVPVEWTAPCRENPPELPLGKLKREIMGITRGRKIAYVVDVVWSSSNADKIISLAEEADHLFIEATFLHQEKERAAARSHLTAHQAGTLAGRARVKHFTIFHHSPRYRGRELELKNEALAAFRAS